MLNLKFHSIRMVFLVPLIISFLLATALITGLVVSEGNRAVEELLNELRASMITLVRNDLDAKLYEAVQLNAIQSMHLSRGILNISEASNREKYLTSLLENFPDAIMTYIAFPSGEFYAARRYSDGIFQVGKNTNETAGNSEYYSTNIMGEGIQLFQVYENFDARTRPWYKQALSVGEMTFSPIYSHFLIKKPTITASVPIFEDGELKAVFGVDYTLEWLSTKIRALNIGSRGQVFIADENMNFVATTTSELTFKDVDGVAVSLPLNESKNELTQRIIKAYQENQKLTSGSVKIKGSNYLYGIDAYDYLGLKWKIFTVIHEGDFLKGMRDVTNQMVYWVGIIAVIFIIGAFVITKVVVKPILALNNSAKELMEGRFEPVAWNNRRDELGELIQSYNAMGEKLMDLVGHLEEEVAQRTAELEEKNELLQDMSYTDSLSQIANRRHFNAFFSAIVDLAPRNHRPIALMMIDIDWFKPYNDTYGHIAGDVVIKQIGNVLKSTIRRHSDLAARYGGEEFVVVLQECSKEYALEMANNVRQKVFDLNIVHESSDWQFVTVSIGLIYREIQMGETMEQLIDAADKALYAAKDSGRNTVTVL